MTETYYDHASGSNLFVRPSAYVYRGLFEDQYFNDLKSYLLDLKENDTGFTYDIGFGRKTYHSTVADSQSIFIESHEKLVPLAREIFNNPNIEKSYCIYSIYKGYKARLFKHIDDNACTYTIDLMVHYRDNWPLVVEGEEFLAEENEAIVYYGEDQYHWRPRFPNPKQNEVGVIFYHFVDKDHWFFTNEKSMSQIVKERENHRNQYNVDTSFDG